ncbi:MAG: hypothetical protein ACE5JD_03590, partial [Candidatus Methylomirabilia bacterium]
MRKFLAAAVSVLFLASFYPAVSEAGAVCTPEVKAAKEMLMKMKVARTSRQLAGARTEVQAPRGQEVQAPRGQEVQAPRSLAGARTEVQAPRGQEVQAPRGQ